MFGFLTTIVVGSVALWIFFTYYKNSKERERLNGLRMRKQVERASQFESYKKRYPWSKEHEEILKLSFSELRQKLQNRELTAANVLKAFTSKSLQVQEEFNCITEFIPRAVDTAQSLDSLHKPKGPLHGIPFCVKDDTRVQGMDSTCGFSARLYQPSKESAVIVQLLEELGAIPFCRTNLPQSCMSIGSDNPIWGITLNPLNKKLSPGGSSSGTASLVAAGGCLFGTGTDSGGSLRIPAHCCGISTLRATFNRISDKGCLHCTPALTTVPGILTKNPEDLALIYESMISLHNNHPLDPRVPSIPWNDATFQSAKPLRIGYFTEIKEMPLVGDVEKVVLEAKAYLQKQGHELVEFQTPSISQLWGSFVMNDDTKKIFLKDIKNDEVSSCMKGLYISSRILLIARPLVSLLICITDMLGIKTMFGSGHPLFVEFEKESFCLEVLQRMERQKIDLILCPPFPFVPLGAKKQGEGNSIKIMFATIYSFMWNLANFPAGVVKFGTESGTRWPKSDSVFDETARLEGIGMPIGVQIVGKPFQEEAVLRVMKQLAMAK